MRTANEQLGRKSRGVPRPCVKVRRRVDPVMARLRERRIELGMTQDELAARIGISVFTVSYGEQGHGSPMLRTLRDWSQALGLKLEVLE